MGFIEFAAKIGKGLLAGLGFAAIVILLLKGCEREQPAPTTAPEKQITGLTTREAPARVSYQKQAQLIDRIKWLVSDSIRHAKGKATTKQVKAQHSAQIYAVTPILANCDTALSDCQQANAAHLEVIALQDRQLNRADSSQVVDRNEIQRSYSAFDSVAVVATGLVQENRKLGQKVTRKNNLLKIGSAVVAVLVAGIMIK